MARSPTPRQTPLEIEHTLDERDAQALNALGNGALQVLETYRLQSANPDVLVTEIRQWQQTAVESLFQVGARLMLLHKVVPHGDWAQRLEEIGMNQRTAQRIVQATIKYTGTGKQRTDKLLALGKTKLLELMVLDDEDIDVLDQGGQVGELDLDDVARMPTSELRAALREARASVEAKDTLIQTKNDKIDDLDTKLRQARKFKPAPGADAQTLEEQALLDEVAAAVRDAELAYARLAVVTASALERCANAAVRGRVAESLRYVHARIEECAKANGFEKLEGGYKPAWDR
jgi:hypothetical protein